MTKTPSATASADGISVQLLDCRGRSQMFPHVLSHNNTSSLLRDKISHGTSARLYRKTAWRGSFSLPCFFFLFPTDPSIGAQRQQQKEKKKKKKKTGATESGRGKEASESPFHVFRRSVSIAYELCTCVPPGDRNCPIPCSQCLTITAQVIALGEAV